MRTQTFLVMIRDGRLAMTIAGALEDRLSHDGRDALVMVPAARALDEMADPADHDWAWNAQRQVYAVTLHEDGLLDWVKALELAAYVGVPLSHEQRAIRWSDQSGAILLPVTSPRALVDAVARHIPWSRHAVAQRPAAPAGQGTPRPAAAGRPAALGRKIAAAGAAGPLLLGLHATAAAATVAAAAGAAPSAGDEGSGPSSLPGVTPVALTVFGSGSSSAAVRASSPGGTVQHGGSGAAAPASTRQPPRPARSPAAAPAAPLPGPAAGTRSAARGSQAAGTGSSNRTPAGAPRAAATVARPGLPEAKAAKAGLAKASVAEVGPARADVTAATVPDAGGSSSGGMVGMPAGASFGGTASSSFGGGAPVTGWADGGYAPSAFSGSSS